MDTLLVVDEDPPVDKMVRRLKASNIPAYICRPEEILRGQVLPRDFGGVILSGSNPSQVTRDTFLLPYPVFSAGVPVLAIASAFRQVLRECGIAVESPQSITSFEWRDITVLFHEDKALFADFSEFQVVRKSGGSWGKITSLRPVRKPSSKIRSYECFRQGFFAIATTVEPREVIAAMNVPMTFWGTQLPLGAESVFNGRAIPPRGSERRLQGLGQEILKNFAEQCRRKVTSPIAA